MIPFCSRNRLTDGGRRLRDVSVRVSPVSKTAALLMVVLGIFAMVAGLTTGTVESTLVGAGIIVLGVIMYRLLYRFTRKVEREIGGKNVA